MIASRLSYSRHAAQPHVKPLEIGTFPDWLRASRLLPQSDCVPTLFHPFPLHFGQQNTHRAQASHREVSPHMQCTLVLLYQLHSQTQLLQRLSACLKRPHPLLQRSERELQQC